MISIPLCLFANNGQKVEAMRIGNTRCEYLKNPLGIDVINPRLSWELVSNERGKRQRAYEIIVSRDSLDALNGIGKVWSPGKVLSSATSHIAYNGKPLESGGKYYWRVRVWDEKNDLSSWSSVASWSMGLLGDGDWKAKWIGLPPIKQIAESDKHIVPPSPLLRKEFLVKKDVKRATLYATALGIYSAYLNGNKVGDHLLAPEWTDYFKRVQYQTYDVTNLLQNSENVIGASIADGWYTGTMFNHQDRGNYGFNRRFLAQLVIEFHDGTFETIVTDGSWRILKDGPIREVSIFDGEIYDENMNPTGWMAPGFNDECWDPVTVDTTISVSLVAQMNEPIKVVEQIKPVAIFEIKKGVYILDMGQNMAGWMKLSLPYNPGKKIILRHGEMLNPDSTLYTENLRIALQTDIYIPGREISIDYEPNFTYHGFRYVEITGLDRKPEKDEIIAQVIASDARVVSDFESSHSGINKLWKNILWTQRGNMHGVPTDCPQRDERAGWMGDAQVFCQTAMYNMDMAAFYTKWFQDIRDMQTPEGRFPNYAPQVDMRYYDAPGWADAGVIIPWKAYLNYGDKRLLENQYEAMRKFIDYVYSKNPNFIWVNAVGNNYGDWLNGNTIKEIDFPKDRGSVPKDLYSTAYFAYSAGLLAKAAKTLGKNKDFQKYSGLAQSIKKAFIGEFMDKNGMLKGNTQAGYAMALEFDLIPDGLKATVAKHMLDAVAYYDYRISTGIHSTFRLMNQLGQFGYLEAAYKLLESHRFPSWLYSVDQGATTIWERWDGYVKGRGFQEASMNSFNHYAIGAVGEWLYRFILGIDPDESNPGYKHFIIKPQPGGTLTWAKGSYHSVAGNIETYWRKSDGEFTLEVNIPANTSATVVLPSGRDIREGNEAIEKIKNIIPKRKGSNYREFMVPSGKWRFTVSGLN